MNKERFKNLNIENISNKINFINWIKSNIKLYTEEQNIPKGDLLLYIDYIDGIVDNNKEIDKLYWKKILNNLRSRVEINE